MKIVKKEKERITYEDACKKTEYQQFKRLLVDGDVTRFVICQTCDDNKLIKYDKGGGTQNLITHTKSFHDNLPATTSQPKIDRYMKHTVTAQEKKSTTDRIALCCANDFRPFYMVEGEGFIELIQWIIDLVAAKGRIDARELLPKSKAVKAHLAQIDEKLREKLKLRMQTIKYVNCTTDHWTEKYSAQSYMTITIHYLDESKKKLMSRVIGSFEVEDKTGATTINEFKSHLREFGLESKVKLIVTDNASSMKLAFNMLDWVSCAVHNISLVHKYAYGGADKSNSNPIPTITSLIITCKQIVTTMKKSGANKKLELTLKQEVETRWDSNYDMLQSILESYDELSKIQSVKDELKLVDKKILMELVELLKPIKELRLRLCCNDQPTFNPVTVTYDKILSIMKPTVSNSGPIRVLKDRFTKFTKEKFQVSRHHVIATFLTPSFKSFIDRFENRKLVDESMDLLTTLMEELPESDSENSQNEVVTETDSNSICADYYEKPSSKFDSEVDKYKKLYLPDINVNALDFWVDNKNAFPRLSNLAMWLLSAPASNIDSERSFSAVGNFITPHRNRLKPESVDELIFVRYNRDLY